MSDMENFSIKNVFLVFLSTASGYFVGAVMGAIAGVILWAFAGIVLGNFVYHSPYTLIINASRLSYSVLCCGRLLLP